MDCHDIRNTIYVYLDGEFAGPEEHAFRSHIERCGECRQLLEREREFIVAFKAQLTSPPAPGDLRQRIEDKLADAPTPERAEPRSHGWRPGWRLALPMAAAAGLAAIVVSGISTMGADARPVVEEAIAAHQNDLPMEVRGSTEQVRRFLQSNVPFAVQIPFTDVQGIELVGARLTRYNGHQAVLFNFDAGGERLSVLQVAADAPGDDAGDEPTVEARQGYRVVTFRHRGLTNSVVGNVTPATMDWVRRGTARKPLLKRASLSQ